MYVEDWDTFAEQSEALFRANPVKTRYVLKYRHCDGKLVLKVTDDVVCLKFATDQQADLKKVEKLNNLFFSLTVLGPDATETESPRAGTPKAGAAALTGRKAKRRG